MDFAARLLHPAVQSLLLAVLCMALVLGRRPRLALSVGTLAIAWIWIASTPAFALRLRAGLTLPAPPRLASEGAMAMTHADAIVVLGGGKLPLGDWDRTTTRAGYALALWREGAAPLMLLSGSDQAHAMAQRFTATGVRASTLRLEDTSRNTHENARNSAALLRADGLRTILLVTSTTHMRRAAAAFRHEGLHVVPAPADDAHAFLERQSPWLPGREALTLTARCVYEYAALWIYRERGWI